VKQAGRELTTPSISEDFNTRLLNKIAQERFSETRTLAYLPHRAPVVNWWQVVPATVVAAMLVVVGIYWMQPGTDSQPTDFAGDGTTSSDLYRTVQPINNPNMTPSLHKNWSFNKQLQQTDRIARLSNMLTDRSGFGNLHLASGLDSRAGYMWHRDVQVINYYRIKPVVRVYQSSSNADSEEDEKVY